MLQQLRLENFKSLTKAKLDFGLITVLIGPNGTGKSSIPQALILLKQSIGGHELKTHGGLIDLGGFNDILTKGASKKEIGVGLSIGIADYPALNIAHGGYYSYDTHFSTKGLIASQAVIGSAQGTHLVGKITAGEGSSVEPKKLMREEFPSGEVYIELTTELRVARPFHISGRTSPLELAAEAEDFEIKIEQLLSAMEILLSATYLVPAIRGLEAPAYDLAKEPIMDFGPGQNAQLASTFAYSGRDIQEIVSIWSEYITGSELAPTLATGRKVTIESYAAPGGIPVIGDGFGTNQLVHILLTLAITPNRSVVAIEEPEIHLHPKAQEKMCSMLVEIAKTRDKQLILTTHSEHVLFGFLAAVRSGTLRKHDLAIYNFEEKGKEPYRLGIDEYGEIDEWRRNFFSWS